MLHIDGVYIPHLPRTERQPRQARHQGSLQEIVSVFLPLSAAFRSSNCLWISSSWGLVSIFILCVSVILCPIFVDFYDKVKDTYKRKDGCYKTGDFENDITIEIQP